MPTFTIGRIAGQYGKPRNGLSGTVNGKEVPKFYGDVINGNGVMERQPDPSRLNEAYMHASSTLNYIRAQHMHGDANYLSNFVWAVGSGVPSTTLAGYLHTADHIEEKLQSDWLRKVTRSFMYTSHEALYLHYEQALTRPVNKEHPGSVIDRTSHRSPATDTAFFNSSAHFVWIGDKTRQLAGAHVEYFRGLANLIGVKLGPSTAPSEVIKLLDVLDPHLEIGKVTLITRMGAKNVGSMLAPIVQLVQASDHVVVWQCDPMHGNTKTTTRGYRTRDFSAILSELNATIVTHARCGSHLGGIHLEMTGDDIFECVGGPSSIEDDELGPKYKTKCDPRLNSQQALLLTYLAARTFKDSSRLPNFRSRL